MYSNPIIKIKNKENVYKFLVIKPQVHTSNFIL